MRIDEARHLKPGDRIVAYNGPYSQRGWVVSIRPHESGRGLWITYAWTRGDTTLTAEKRHVSVHLDEEATDAKTNGS